MALDGTSERRALLPPRFSVVSSGRCGRPRRRRRSMDQKTRVAVKYRSTWAMVIISVCQFMFMDRRLRHPLFTPFLGIFLALKFVEHGFTP